VRSLKQYVPLAIASIASGQAACADAGEEAESPDVDPKHGAELVT